MSGAGRLVRFAAVGVGNTGLTTALLVLLTFLVDVQIAYAIAYGTGLCFATWANASFVFRSSLSARRAISFACWYVGVFVLGLLVLRLLRDRTDLTDPLVALAVVAVTAPVNFVGGRLIFPAEPRPSIEPRSQESV